MLSNANKRRSEAHITGRKINNSNMVLEYLSPQNTNQSDKYPIVVEKADKKKSLSTKNLHQFIEKQESIKQQLNNPEQFKFQNYSTFVMQNQTVKNKHQKNPGIINELHSDRSDTSQDFEQHINQKYYRSPSAPKFPAKRSQLHSKTNTMSNLVSTTSPQNFISPKTNVSHSRNSPDLASKSLNMIHKKKKKRILSEFNFNGQITQDGFNTSSNQSLMQQRSMLNKNGQKKTASKSQKSSSQISDENRYKNTHKQSNHSVLNNDDSQNTEKKNYSVNLSSQIKQSTKMNGGGGSDVDHIKHSMSKVKKSKTKHHSKKLSQISSATSPNNNIFDIKHIKLHHSASKSCKSKRRLKSTEYPREDSHHEGSNKNLKSHCNVEKQHSPNRGNNLKSSKNTLEQSIHTKQSIDKLIQENLIKAKWKKQTEILEKNQQEEDKMRKQLYLDSINNDIRQFNALRFNKKRNEQQQQQEGDYNMNDSEANRKIPWGANQQKLKEYAIGLLQKYYKSSQNHGSDQLVEDQDQKKKQFNIYYKNDKNYNQSCDILQRREESERRERLGLGFLKEFDEGFIEQIVQKNKDKLANEVQDTQPQDILQVIQQQKQKKENFQS